MHKEDPEINKLAALEAMKWYGWGSPIGLSIFFLGVSILLFAIGYISH